MSDSPPAPGETFPTRAAPAVTVLIPAFNAARYVEEAVRSILSQTYTDFELLIINDGSTDGTGAILAKLAGEDGRIRLLEQPNRGLIATLNTGVAEARGALLARMDADDIALADRLQKQVTFLQQHPEVAVVGGAIRVFGVKVPNPFVRRYPFDAAAIRAALRTECCFAHPTIMGRTAILRAAGGYRRAFRHGEDYDLWLRISEHHDLANLDEVLLDYRRHEQTVGSLHALQQNLSTLGSIVSARLRREGKTDVFSSADVVTRELLIDCGADADEVDERLVRSLLGYAIVSSSMGLLDEAQRLITEAAGLKTSPALRRKLRGPLLNAQGRFDWQTGRRVRGLLAMIRAAVSSPSSVLGRLQRATV